MKPATKQIINVMNVLTWIAFIGICIKTGSIIWSFCASLFIDPAASKNLYIQLDLSALKNFSITQYCMMVSVVIALWMMKAFLFYLVIKIFLKINFVHPFSNDIAVLLKKISAVGLIIGIGSGIATGYCNSYIKHSVEVNNLSPYISGASEFVFFAGIIFIISLVMQRGIELQAESDLTV